MVIHEDTMDKLLPGSSVDEGTSFGARSYEEGRSSRRSVDSPYPLMGNTRDAAGRVSDGGSPHLFYADPKSPIADLTDGRVSLSKMLMITSFNFPFGGICGPMGVAILPLEAEKLSPENGSILLGISMALVGVTQLICPWSGKMSDCHQNTFGKRRPFLVAGGVTTIACIGLMWYFSVLGWKWSYVFSLAGAMTGLNVAYSASYGLVPDLIPVEEQGTASGLVGAHTLFGSLAGFLFLIFTHELDYHLNYLYYMVSLAISVVIIVAVAKENDSTKMDAESYSWREVAASYTIDLSHGYDFLWVFIGRTLYYIGISCQSFILFYMRDVINVDDVKEQKYHVGSMGLLSQFVGGIVAYQAGKLSDMGWSRKRTVYFACFIMAWVYSMFLATPFIFSNEIRLKLNHLNVDKFFKKYYKQYNNLFDQSGAEAAGTSGTSPSANLAGGSTASTGSSTAASGSSPGSSTVSASSTVAADGSLIIGAGHSLAGSSSSSTNESSRRKMSEENWAQIGEKVAAERGADHRVSLNEVVSYLRLYVAKYLNSHQPHERVVWINVPTSSSSTSSGSSMSSNLPQMSEQESFKMVNSNHHRIENFIRDLFGDAKWESKRQELLSALLKDESLRKIVEEFKHTGRISDVQLEQHPNTTDGHVIKLKVVRQHNGPQNGYSPSDYESNAVTDYETNAVDTLAENPARTTFFRKNSSRIVRDASIFSKMCSLYRRNPFNIALPHRFHHSWLHIPFRHNRRKLVAGSPILYNSGQSNLVDTSLTGLNSGTGGVLETAADLKAGRTAALANAVNAGANTQISVSSSGGSTAGEEEGEETDLLNPHGVDSVTQQYEIFFLYFCMFIYGIGNGAYLAVDLALALDCLPNPETTAQSLGIWGVSAFIGLAIGPLLWAACLELSGGKTVGDNLRVYPYTGYAWMLSGGCVFCFASGYVVHWIKKST